MTITTAMCTSFKQEILSAGHCFLATVNPTCGATASGATTITGLSSMNGVAVGMNVAGPAGLGATTYIANILSTTSITMAPANTASFAASTLTISGDQFNLALIRQGMTGNYTSLTTNYSQLSVDEVSGATSGYTLTGYALTNVSPTTTTTTALTTFSVNPSWTSATFSTAGCMIYNSSVRDGSSVTGFGGGRTCSVHDFSGNQVVSSGTFTVLLPTANSTSAILRIQ